MLAKAKSIYPRAHAAFRYLKWGRDLREWRITSGQCPSCTGKYFLSIKPLPFMTRCLKCFSNVTNAAVIDVMTQHQQKVRVRDVWEMSTYGPVLAYSRRTFPNVVASEYIPTAQPGELVNAIRNEDVQNLSFPDSSLDMITSNQVFEHVEDDIKGYAECFRVLRPQGALLFTIPLYDTVTTEQTAKVVDGSIVHLAEPEYHGSRTGGAKTALVYWKHSINDIVRRVAQVGFTVRIIDVKIARGQRQAQPVIYAVKAMA